MESTGLGGGSSQGGGLGGYLYPPPADSDDDDASTARADDASAARDMSMGMSMPTAGQQTHPQPQAVARYQTLRCAAAIAAQLAETHRLLGGCLRGDLDLPPPTPEGPEQGSPACQPKPPPSAPANGNDGSGSGRGSNGGSSSGGKATTGEAASHTIVPSVKTALLRDETLRQRFGQYYLSPAAAAAAAAAATPDDPAASVLPAPCRHHGGAVRIAAAARAYEEECARQHARQMHKRRKLLQKLLKEQEQEQAQAQQQEKEQAALWSAQQGQMLTDAAVGLLQDHLDRLLRAVAAECHLLQGDASFVEKILDILAAPPHANSFDPESIRTIGDRLSGIKVAAGMALRRGGEGGCELERAALADARLAGGGQPVVPALWAGPGSEALGLGLGAPSTPTPTAAAKAGAFKGKRKRSASKKMIEAESDAAYEQRMEMERKRQRSKGGGSGGSGKKNKKNGKKPSPRGSGSPKFPHPSTDNKTQPGHSGGSSPEAAAAAAASGSGSKRQQTTAKTPSSSSSASSPSRIGFGRDGPSRPNVTIVDSNPNRITNPLLSLPLYPRGVTGPNGTSTAPGRSGIVIAARVSGMMGGDASSSSGAAAAGKGSDVIGGPVASGAAAMGGDGVAVGAAGLPFRPDLIPHGGEMWGVMELYDPKIVDTFPLSYLARLLGFDVPHSVPQSDVAATAEQDVAALFAGTEMEAVLEAVTAIAKRKEVKSTERSEIKPFQKFDPATLKLMKSKVDIWMTVPELGQFASIIRSNKRRRIDEAIDALGDIDEDDDFFDLDVIDPMWKAILSDRTLLSGGSEVKIRQSELVCSPAATAKAVNVAAADADAAANVAGSSPAPAPATLLNAAAGPVGAPPIGEPSALAPSDPNDRASTEPPEEGAIDSSSSKPMAASDTCTTTAEISASAAAGPPLTESCALSDKSASSSSLSVRVVPITFGVRPNVKLANGSYYHFISDHCLNCAKELVAGAFADRKACVPNVLSPDGRVIQLLREGRVTFRIATVGDEELLYRLNANKTRFHSVADYAYALRSGHFFIIALENIRECPSVGGTNDSGDIVPSPVFAPLGYVHYTFCWYKIGAIPKDDVGPSVSDQTSSLYGVTSTASSIKPSTVSELVFGLDEIQCAPEGIAIREGQAVPEINKDSSGSADVGCDFLPTVLTALALEHVRGNDIWYGIANVTTSFEARILKKYFRMTSLLSDDRHLPTGDGYPLACDMKKSSFRFAFLRYLDEQRQRSCGTTLITKKKACDKPSIRERMLVRFPDMNTLQASLKISPSKDDEVSKRGPPQSISVGTGTTIQISLQGSSAGPSAAVPIAITCRETEEQDGGGAGDTTDAPQPASTIAASVVQVVSATTSMPEVNAENIIVESSQKECGPALAFTSASTEIRSKTVGVRVSISANDEIKTGQAKVQLLSAGNETSPIKGGQFFKDPTWKVLKTFARPDSSPVATNATSISPSTDESPDGPISQNDGTILADLLRKQDELRKLEGSFEPKLRSLLTQAYHERVAYEAKECVEERAQAKTFISKYEAEISRKREADAAWQAQLEQDMDAVCDICLDGDVTVDNQILFCESCNVAIHQACYGIPQVPTGDYFCKACLHFGRDKEARAQASRTAVAATAAHLRHKPLKICCELCPRRQGAFVRAIWEGEKESDNPNKAKWVHVTCSKWLGLSYRDEVKQDVIVDAIDMREQFRNHVEYYQCYLCESGRGAFNKCEEEGCNNWVHIQCARLSGNCRVIHGENCYGEIEIENKDLLWKIFCPLHSGIAADDIPKGSLSKEQLKAAANTFPPEPRRPAHPDTFDRLSGKDRAEFWADPTRQGQMLERLTGMVEGARCAVCNIIDPTDQFDASGRSRNRLAKCTCCGVVVHRTCYTGPPTRSEKEFVCQSCQYVAAEKDNEKFEIPQCHMCNMKGGVLRKAYAIPGSKKRFKGDQKRFEQTLFGKQIWCHTICAMWSHHVEYTLAEDINCSQLIMANGTSHVGSKYHCDLCGRKDGVKFSCTMKECHNSGGAMVPYRFHLTCGRQAGLDVHDVDNDTQGFYVKCFHHVRCSEVVRAKMEDMLEVEKRRCGKMLERAAMPMPFGDAAQLMHWSVTVLANLGWAWRWSEWWVERGDNWEPLLEPGQKEEKMTKDQLKIVDSTPQSRCADARKCRLAAFGAALRNRDYDKEQGDDTIALDKALRAILDTPSLVGPLRPPEKDFYAEWLGRAYRSKSPLLGFGDDKIPVDEEFCTHIEDKSPKYILGNRPLPGRPLPAGGEGFVEIDDFLRVRPEPVEQSPPPKRGGASKKRSLEDDVAIAQPRRWSSRAKAPTVKFEEEPETLSYSSPKKAKKGPDADGKYHRPSGRSPAGKSWDYDTGKWVAKPEIESSEPVIMETTDEPEAKIEKVRKGGVNGHKKKKAGKNRCRVDGCNKFKQSNCDDMCRAHWKESLETKE